jgi:hypothetical protein
MHHPGRTGDPGGAMLNDVGEREVHSGALRTGAAARRRFLDRFRRASGVPAAAGDDLLAELAPLFLVLDELDAEAAKISAFAERRARAERDEASEDIEVILAEAMEQAEAERADIAKAVQRSAGAEARSIVEAGRAEGERIRAIGRERIPALAASIAAKLDAPEGLPE